VFRIFKRKTPEELAVRELKRLRKRIVKEGGPEKVCYLFWKFLENDELYKDIGIVSEQDAPFPRMMAIFSALDLLNSWKKTSDDNPDIKEVMELLSKRVYIAGLLTFNHEEMLNLYEEVGGIPGLSTTDPDAAEIAGSTLQAKVKAKTKKAEDAWLRWREADFDVFEAIRKA